MDIQKSNDMFVAVLQKPDANVFDLASSNIIPDNTQLLPIDTYKNLDKVKEVFKNEDGSFNDDAFLSAYQKASDLYLNLDLDKSLASALEYDPMDFTAPTGAKKMDVRPTIVKDFNPHKLLYSRSGINSIDENNLSLRELAQQGKIYDYENDKWLDKTANDLGWFGSMFNETLVYAQWDEDGISKDPFSGQLKEHTKGEWKYDNNGNLYVETLGGREVHSKQIVNPGDLLTDEGTWANRVDFFDSDGKNKTMIGTTMKIAAEVAPLLVPGLNVWYGGFKMAEGLAAVLPTFYKAGEGLFLGDNESGIETPMWEAMNSMEGFMSKYIDKSISDNAQKSMWNYEQLGSLISDVFTQIYEQRAAASISKLFYKTNDTEYLTKLTAKTSELIKNAAYKGVIKSGKEAELIAQKALGKVASLKELASKRSKLAKSLSLGYMAMTQSADVYGQALEGGYDRRAAGFTALLAASGQYGLMMNNRMGDWFLDKSTGYTAGVSKSQMTKLANTYLDDAAKAVEKLAVDKDAGKVALGNIFKSFKKKADDLVLHPIDGNTLTENLFKKSVIEGVEEVTEELAIDMAKGVTDVFSAMGFTARQGSFGGFDNVFSSEGFQRYALSLVGGAIGGSMFELESSTISPAIKSLITGQAIPKPTKMDIYDIVSQGETKEFIEIIQKNKSRFGSTTLSPIVSDIEGDKTYLPTEGTELSQADVIANQVIEYVKHVDKIVNLENLGNTDEELIEKAITDHLYIRDLKKSGVDSFILSDAKQIGEEIVSLNEMLQSVNTNKNEKNEQESDARIKDLTEQLTAKREEFTELVTGEKSEYYHKLSLFALNETLHKPFLKLTTQEYIKEKYNEDYHSLPTNQKKSRDTEFKTLMEGEVDYKNKMKFMFESFLKINEDFSKDLAEYDLDGYASVRSQFYDILHKIEDKTNPFIKGKISILDTLERLNEVNRSLIKNGFKTQSLDSQTDISVGQFLVDSGFIEVTANPEERSKMMKDYYTKLIGLFESTKLESESDEEYVARMTSLIIADPEAMLSTLSPDDQIKANVLTEKYNKDINKGRAVEEQEKEILAKQIDRIGMPSTEFNLEALQEQITIFLGEEAEFFKATKEKIDKEIPDPTKRLEAMAEIAQSRGVFPNFKVKDKGLVVNPKRALLFKYAEQVMASNVGIDNEVISELTEERKIIQDYYDEVFYNDTAYTEEDLEEAEKELERIDKILQYDNKKINSLYEKLRKFEIELFGTAGPISMFKVLEENVDAFGRITNSAEFKRTDVELEQIKKAIYVLNAVKSVTGAMSSTEVNVSNLYGFNVSLNKALEKEGNEPLYETLNSNATVHLLKDLNLIENKLNYFKRIAENNSTTIPEEQLKIQNAMIAGLAEQAMNKENELSLVNLKVNGVSLFGVDDLTRINEVENQEKKLIVIESIFYDNFHKAEGTVKEKLDSLFEAFIQDDSKSKTLVEFTESRDSNLNADFKVLESFDWYQYIHSILAYNSSNFYIDYENNIKKELTLQNKKSPFFSQQFALRQALAYFENKQIMAHSINFLEGDIENSLDLSRDVDQETLIKELRVKIKKLSSFPMDNVMVIRGSGGTGKSSVLGNMTLRNIIEQKTLGETIEIVAVAPNEDTLQILSSDVKGEIANDIATKNKEDFFRTILKPEGVILLESVRKTLEDNDYSEKLNEESDDVFIDPKYFVIGDGDGAIVITNKFYEDFMLDFDEEASPRVIVIDEMSKFTTLEWQLLNKIAKPNTSKNREYDNFYVLLMGDELQNGVILGNTNFSLDNITFPSTVKLKNPIRSKNVHKNRNNIELELHTYLQKLVELYGLKDTVIPKLTINYFEKEGEYLSGDKFSKATTENQIIKEISKLNPDKQIAVITDTGTIPENIKQALISVFGKNTSDNMFGTKEIEIYPEDVQGREFDQVIITSKLNKGESKYINSKNLYTLLSRAKEASLIFSDTNIEIDNKVQSFNTSYEMDNNIILKSLEDRSKVLEELVKGLKKSTNKKEVVVKDDNDPIDLEENQEEEVVYTDNDKGEPGKNKALSYSFYNNIGVLGQEILDYLDYTITFDSSEENTITWDELLDKLGQPTGTDLFSLDIDNVENKKVYEVINEYITFKNHLLFDKPLNTLFGKTYTTGELMLKRLDEYSPSYQKIVKAKTQTNPIYVLGRYIKLGVSEKEVFVTISAMPDATNQNVIDSIDIDKLNNIYKQVDEGDNSEISVNEKALDLEVFGVQVPKHEDKSTGITPVAVSDIPKTFPGVSMSEIMVFRDDVDYIRNEFKKYETSPVENEKRDFSKYRFRPYVILSYVEGNIRYSKLVILQAKSRSFNEFWAELTDTQESAKTKSKNNVDDNPLQTAHLLSKYKGWEMIFEFLNSIEDVNEKQDVADSLKTTYKGLNQGKIFSWTPFDKVIDSFVEHKADPNNPVNFFDFVNDQDRKVKNLIIDAKDSQEFKIANPIFLLYKAHGNNTISNAFDKFKSEKGNDIELYYNTIIESIKSFAEGDKVGKLNSAYNKFYTMNYAIEPNKISVNMDTLVNESKKPKSTVVVDDDLTFEDKTLNVNIDGVTDPFTYNITTDSTKDPNSNIIIKIDPSVVTDNKNMLSLMESMNEFAMNSAASLEWEMSDEDGREGQLVTYDEDGDEIYLFDVLNAVYNSDNYVETSQISEKTGGKKYKPNNINIIIDDSRSKQLCNWS